MALARSARRCRWYDLAGERALAGDHDQLPVTGADREGLGVIVFENAQHVGHLLAVIWAGPPADHDPLADVGGGEPDMAAGAARGTRLAFPVDRAAALVASMVEGAPATTAASPDELTRGRLRPAPLHPELTNYR